MSKPPAPFLGVTMGTGEVEVDITEVELQYGVSAGILLRLPVSGIVPTYEEHAARLEANIDLHDWGEMDYMEKALLIAHRRNQIAIKNQQAEAEIRDAKRRSKPKEN